VAWPWPWEIEPVTSVSPPSGSKRISAVSMVGSAACSMVVGNADAAQHAASRGFFLPRLEALPVRELHGAVEVLLEMPAVIREDQRRLVGHGLRRNVLRRRSSAGSMLSRRQRYRSALDHVRRLGAAGAAVGRGAMVLVSMPDTATCSAGVV